MRIIETSLAVTTLAPIVDWFTNHGISEVKEVTRNGEKGVQGEVYVNLSKAKTSLFSQLKVLSDIHMVDPDGDPETEVRTAYYATVDIGGIVGTFTLFEELEHIDVSFDYIKG